MEKLSLFCKRAMLGILLFLLLLTLGIMLSQGLVHPSYPAALGLGAVGMAGLYGLLRRCAVPVPRHAAVWAAVFCFVINLPWVLIVHIQPGGDYKDYWNLACALAAGSPVPNADMIAVFPHLFGTGSFLSIFLRLFGTSLYTVTLLNVLWVSLSCALVFLLGRKLRSEEAGFLAALFWAVMPSKLMLNSLVFSEPIYTLFLLLFFYLFWELSERLSAPEPKHAPAVIAGVAALGLLLAAINFIRPLATILLIALWLWFLFLRGACDGKAWLRWFAALLALTLVYGGALALWRSHLEAVIGEESATVPWYNIYVGFNEESGGQYSEPDIDLLFSYMKQGQTADEAQKSMIPHVRERLASLRNLPRLFLTKLLAFLGNDELGGFSYHYSHTPLFVRICMVICNIGYYGIYLAALAGLWRMLRSPRLSAGLLIPLFFIGLTLAHLLVEVTVRYHYSLMPLLCLFAGMGMDRRKPE